jgi:hypothetical protein
MTYFAIILLPYIMGAGLIALGLRVSPYFFAFGVLIFAASWIFG